MSCPMPVLNSTMTGSQQLSDELGRRPEVCGYVLWPGTHTHRVRGSHHRAPDHETSSPPIITSRVCREDRRLEPHRLYHLVPSVTQARRAQA